MTFCATKQSSMACKSEVRIAARLKDARNDIKHAAFTLSCKSSLSSLSLLPGFVSSALSSLRLSHNRARSFHSTPPYAFTLAETLIALVIIGIIAAITVPNIVAHQREVATVEKVKKFYSGMRNAIKLAVTNTGLNVDEWDVGYSTSLSKQSAIKFLSYIKPYLIISVENCQGSSNGGCFLYSATKRLNGQDYNTIYSSLSHYGIILNDGSVVVLHTYECKNNSCAVFYYDVNGTKEPNTLGKDIFRFMLNGNEFLPSAGDCTSTGDGCAKNILKNGNMNYLH